MADSNRSRPFTFEGPAVYRIVVQGRLDQSQSVRLGGMSLDAANGQGHPQVTTTTLVGRLRDQAELSGVLNTLYELHLPVLEVRKLDDE